MFKDNLALQQKAQKGSSAQRFEIMTESTETDVKSIVTFDFLIDLMKTRMAQRQKGCNVKVLEYDEVMQVAQDEGLQRMDIVMKLLTTYDENYFRFVRQFPTTTEFVFPGIISFLAKNVYSMLWIDGDDLPKGLWYIPKCDVDETEVKFRFNLIKAVCSICWKGVLIVASSRFKNKHNVVGETVNVFSTPISKYFADEAIMFIQEQQGLLRELIALKKLAGGVGFSESEDWMTSCCTFALVNETSDVLCNISMTVTTEFKSAITSRSQRKEARTERRRKMWTKKWNEERDAMRVLLGAEITGQKRKRDQVDSDDDDDDSEIEGQSKRQKHLE